MGLERQTPRHSINDRAAYLGQQSPIRCFYAMVIQQYQWMWLTSIYYSSHKKNHNLGLDWRLRGKRRSLPQLKLQVFHHAGIATARKAVGTMTRGCQEAIIIRNIRRCRQKNKCCVVYLLLKINQYNINKSLKLKDGYPVDVLNGFFHIAWPYIQFATQTPTELSGVRGCYN